MKWWLDVPTPADAKYWATLIQRWEAPRDWRKALERVPVDLREVAEQYLRIIASRLRLAKELKDEIAKR